MATTYSDVKNSPKFGHFIRAVIGLPYAPLDRLEEAMRVLEKIAKTNIVQRKFCHQMLQYLWKTWLDGNIPRRVWNMYQHQGVKTIMQKIFLQREAFFRWRPFWSYFVKMAILTFIW